MSQRQLSSFVNRTTTASADFMHEIPVCGLPESLWKDTENGVHNKTDARLRWR